jgi:hypothetical protein
MGNIASLSLLNNSTTSVTFSYINLNDDKEHIIAQSSNGNTSITQLQNMTNDQTFSGEISIDISMASRRIRLRESQKIIMKVVYILPNPNLSIPVSHGLGHIVLRYPGKCASIQICLDNLSIDGTTVTAIYNGYLDKNFEFDQSSKTSIDACTTFLITCKQ